jgi:hypothetical protein
MHVHVHLVQKLLKPHLHGLVARLASLYINCLAKWCRLDSIGLISSFHD